MFHKFLEVAFPAAFFILRNLAQQIQVHLGAEMVIPHLKKHDFTHNHNEPEGAKIRKHFPSLLDVSKENINRWLPLARTFFISGHNKCQSWQIRGFCGTVFPTKMAISRAIACIWYSIANIKAGSTDSKEEITLGTGCRKNGPFICKDESTYQFRATKMRVPLSRTIDLCFFWGGNIGVRKCLHIKTTERLNFEQPKCQRYLVRTKFYTLLYFERHPHSNEYVVELSIAM